MDEDISYLEDVEGNGEEVLNPEDPEHAFVLLERKFNKASENLRKETI